MASPDRSPNISTDEELVFGPPPDRFDADEKTLFREYSKLVADTIAREELRAGDRVTLEALVSLTVEERRLSETVKREGPYIQTDRGGIKSHPAAVLRQGILREVRYLLKELRMTPHTRGAAASATKQAGARPYAKPAKPALVGADPSVKRFAGIAQDPD